MIATKTTPEARDTAFVQAAQKLHHEDGVLEIDDDAEVSTSDSGAYVRAWVWVDNEDCEEQE